MTVIVNDDCGELTASDNWTVIVKVPTSAATVGLKVNVFEAIEKEMKLGKVVIRLNVTASPS